MIEPGSLSGLLAFVQAVEAGSFTQAAKRLGISKSAVGKSVAQMEQRLGVRLLNRTTRSLGLTTDGETYYAACTRALSELDAAQALLAEGRQMPSGRLRMDAPLAFARACVVPMLPELAGRYPNLTFDISFGGRVADLVDEGVDLAIRIGDLEDRTGLVARRLCSISRALCAAPSYLDKHGRPQTIEDLERHSLVVRSRDGMVRPWHLKDAGGRPRTVVPRARFMLGHVEAVVDAAVAGCGIAFLSNWLISEQLRRGELEVVLCDLLDEKLVVNAVWPAARVVPPKVRVMVDALVARFSKPSWERPQSGGEVPA